MIKEVMFNNDNHEKDILAVSYKDKTIQTQDTWNKLNLMYIQYMLGTNHLLPLSHMAKSYIWLEEKNQLINEFSIGYTMNTNLSMNKAFKEQMKVCMKNKISTETMTHISKYY